MTSPSPTSDGAGLGATRGSHGDERDRTAANRAGRRPCVGQRNTDRCGQLISASPCDKGIRLPPISRGTRVLPTAQQVHDLARLLPARLAATVYLAAGCGLRMGEILGLEMDDIDFDAREVHVRRQLKVLKGRQPFLGPVKTNTSARTVELPEVVAVALRQHLADGCDAVEVDDDTDRRRPVRRAARLLFRGVGGEPVNAATFSRTWRLLGKRSACQRGGGYTDCGTTTRRC